MIKTYLFSILMSLTFLCNAQLEVNLYENKIPNSKTTPNEEKRSFDMECDTIVLNISRPTLSVYLPSTKNTNCSAVIICPGGGYHCLSINREGKDIAKAFNQFGVAAFVLKYRLPSDKIMKDKSMGPLQDAQKSIQMVREHAAEWHVDPNKIGIMGFSAGGHLAATAGTHYENALIDNKNGTSLRPDFMILVYPVISFTDSIGHIGSRDNLLGKSPSKEQIRYFSNEEHVSSTTPPAFITQANDDIVVPIANSLVFYEALKKVFRPCRAACLFRRWTWLLKTASI